MSTDYRTLIPSANQKPNFLRVIDETANAIGAIVDTALSMPLAFDVDVATGDQLDIIGMWVGVPRTIAVPLAIFFSWDTPNLGWDQGQWKGAHQSTTSVVSMDDETYRLVLLTVIQANQWDGTLTQYQKVMQTAFPKNVFKATDNQNMTMSITITGPPLTPIMSAVLQSGPLSKIKPGGVAISSYTLP